MATEADIPVPVCEARGDQVGTIVDNIIKISVGQVSLEKQTQDDKHNEIPIVVGKNFIKPPSTVEVHSEATPDVSKVIEKPDQTVKEDVDTLLLSTKETSSDLNGTSDSYTEKIELTKEILQETSLPGEETASPTPCMSESEELNVQLKTVENKSDEKPTEEDMSSNLINEVASEQEGLKTERSVEENLNASAEKVSLESIITPGYTITKEEDEELKEAELSERCSPVKEDKHIENHAESLHAESDLSQENSIEGPPEEQSRDVTRHGNTNEAEEATTDADDEHKESPESLSPIVSCSHEEGSVNAVLEEDTSDHKNGKIVFEVDKHQEALESPSSGEAHCEVTNVSPDVSKGTENTDQKTEDGTDTLLLSPKLAEQPVESAANEGTSAEEIQQHADKDAETEQHSKNSAVLTPEDGHDKGDTREVTQIPNDISSGHNCTNDSSAENFTLTEDKLQEINLVSEEILSNVPYISEVEELNILVKTADDKSVNEKPTEEDMSCNITNGESKEGESDQYEMTSEQEGLQNNYHTHGKTIDEVEKHQEVLEDLSSGEAHSEVNNFSPEVSTDTENTDQTVKDGTGTLLLSPKLADQPVEFAADEVTSAEAIQQNAEESDITDKDVVPEQCIDDSPVVASVIDDPDVDEAKVVTQLSKDPSSDHQGTNDSSRETVALTEEIIQETNLANEETESDTACISEAEELNVQVKTTDNKHADEKPTEEDISRDLTNEVCEIEEVGQNKMTSEQEVLESERSVEDDFNTSADEVSHEYSTSGETITALETPNSDELQSKSDLNSSLSKEEETTVQVGDGSVTTSEDIGVPSGNTLSRGDVECQSKTLEDEEHKIAEFSESEHSLRCTSVKEDVQIEIPAESLHVDLGNIEVPNSSQENKTEYLPVEESIDAADSQKDDHESFPPIVSVPFEEGNVNAVLQEIATVRTDEKIIDEVDKHEEVTKSLSTTVSTEDDEGSSLSKSDHSENKREDDSVKECEEVPLPLPLAREIDYVPTDLHEAQFEDEETEKAGVCDDERSTESMLLKTESITENTENEHVNSEHTKASDLVENRSEGGTVDAAEEKEETPQNVPAVVPNDMMEENSYIEVDDQKRENEEHLDEENDQLSSITNNDEGVVKDEAKIEDENPSGAVLFESNKNTESGEIEETAVEAPNTNEKTRILQNVSNEDSDTEMKRDTDLEEEHERQSLTEASKENPNDDKPTILPEHKTDNEEVELLADEKSTGCAAPEKESLQLEDLTASPLSADIETTSSLSDKAIDATDRELIFENVATEVPHEHTEENSVPQVDFTETEQDEHLEKDNQELSMPEALESKDIDELKNRGEDFIKPDLETGENTETTSMKEETEVDKPIDSLQIKPEDTKQQDSSPDINRSISEQISITDQREISIDSTERESFETAQTNEECVEIKDIAKDIPDCDEEDSIQIKEVDSPNPLNEASEGNANDDESTRITEDCLIKEGESPESLQLAAQDIETPPISQDRELSSLDEHSPISYPKGITVDSKEEIADDVTGLDDESPKDKDVVISVPSGDNEDNSPTEVDGIQKPSEKSLAEKIDDDEPTTTPEAKFTNEDAEQANLSECAIIKEEVQIDSLHVADEDIKDSSSAQDREVIHFEEQEPTKDSHGATGDPKDAETLDLTDPKEENLEDKNHETTRHEDTIEDSLQVDGSILEEKEQLEKDSESTAITDAPEDNITERTLATEVAQVENHIDSSQVASEDTGEFAPCQDSMEQILDSKDISSNEVTEKIADAMKEEVQEARDLAKTAPHEDSSPNEQNTEAALTNEDLSTELPQIVVEDTKESCLSEVRETSSQEEQIPGVVIKDNKENETIDPTFFEKEIPEDEVLKEMESVDIKAATNEEEDYFKGVHTTTADTIVASNQETSLSLTAEKTPCPEDLNVNKDITEDILEASNYKQQESSITEMFEEHTVTSEEHVSDSTGMESEVSEKNNDQNVEEANSCGDQTDSEKIEVLNHGFTTVPTSETLEVTDPRGCTETEVQVPCEEKEAEVINQEAENDEKNIKEILPNDASEDVSESKVVNGEDEIDSNNYKELSSSPISVASEEVSTSNVALEEDLTSTTSQEPRKGRREEAETEEDQNQEPAPQVSEPIQDSPVEIIERDAPLSLASADDSVVTEEMQELERVPLPALEENIIETTDCKESDVIEGAPNDKCIDHLEQDDVTNSFSYDKMPTEKEQETVANDVLPASSIETPGVDHSPAERELTNKEEPCTGSTATGDDAEKGDKGNDAGKEACEEMSDSMVINEDTSLEGNLVDKSSFADLETKNDEKASGIKETAPSSAIGQDVESASVQETSYYSGSLAEEKSDSNEVATTPIENKSGYDSNNQGLEPKAQDQSCDINSKTEEEKLEANAEIQFDKAVKEDIQEEIKHEKEIAKEDILSEKEQSPRVKEKDEDIQEYHQSSCEDEVITDSHQEEEANQDQQVNSKETDELTNYGDETETVAKVAAHVNDKVPEEPEDKEVASEAVERILHQEDHVTSPEEPTTDIDDEKANESDIACAQIDTQDKEDGAQIAVVPDGESEEQNKKDKICSTVQAKDEEELILSEEKTEEEAKETCKEAYVEAEKLDFAPETNEISECAISDGSQDIPKDNENSTTNTFSEEDHPTKTRECEVPSAGEDVAVPEQSTEETVITAEVQEAKSGIDLEDAVPVAAGLQSQEVEEFDDKCVEMADTSAPVENPTDSTSKFIPELAEGTPQEAKYTETNLHGLPEELNTKDSEVKAAERDDAGNLQSVRDVSEECKESFEVSNNENPTEGYPAEKTESSEVQETEPIQNAPVSETLKQETEEQQLVRGTEDVHEEAQKSYNIIPKQLESSYGAESEKVSESSIHQSSTEDTTQHEKKEENQQDDYPLLSPHAQCSVIKTSEKDLPVNVEGLSNDDASEQRDKHVVLETDDKKNLNTENLDGDSSTSEISRGEHETVKPQKLEKEERGCNNEEGTNQEMKAKPESEETSLMADHSPTGKEPTSHTDDPQAEKTNEDEHETSKTDDEKDDEEESSREQEKSDLSSDAPVMVDMGDADVKVTPKKSHNILSGVGSKVKHSIAKVKKAITGKSSHPKTPSPSKVVN